MGGRIRIALTKPGRQASIHSDRPWPLSRIATDRCASEMRLTTLPTIEGRAVDAAVAISVSDAMPGAATSATDAEEAMATSDEPENEEGEDKKSDTP